MWVSTSLTWTSQSAHVVVLPLCHHWYQTALLFEWPLRVTEIILDVDRPQDIRDISRLGLCRGVRKVRVLTVSGDVSGAKVWPTDTCRLTETTWPLRWTDCIVWVAFFLHSFCGKRVDNPKLRNSRNWDPQAFQLKWILRNVWKN